MLLPNQVSSIANISRKKISTKNVRRYASAIVIRAFVSQRDFPMITRASEARTGISVDHPKEVRFMLTINHTRLRFHDTGTGGKQRVPLSLWYARQFHHT